MHSYNFGLVYVDIQIIREGLILEFLESYLYDDEKTPALLSILAESDFRNEML